jgi:hypothetical protein
VVRGDSNNVERSNLVDGLRRRVELNLAAWAKREADENKKWLRPDRKEGSSLVEKGRLRADTRHGH